MDFLSLIAAAVVATSAALVLKTQKPEYSIYISLACGCAILLAVINSIDNVIGFTDKLMKNTGIATENFDILFKAVGIGYITQFASDLCKDSGESSISTNIELAGKITILILAFPMIESLYEMIEAIVTSG